MDDDPVRSRLRLEPRASSVSEARRLVRRTIADAGFDDLAEAAELVTSELVTNALVHAGTYVDVTVELRHGSVRVEIADGSPHLPAPRKYGTSAATGRGLVVVEQIVDDWGVAGRSAGSPGKVVWFEIGSRKVPGGAQPVEAGAGIWPAMDVVEVLLLDVPLLLHAAWQQQAQGLLRERLLATLEEGNGDKAVRVHADASDALALLAEHLPTPDLGERPEALLDAAADPSVATVDATVPVPAESVAHFAALDRSLAEAVAGAAADLMLTPPSQPELQTFRRWICQEVRQQSEGAPPVPWSSDEEAPSTMTAAPTWDSTHIAESQEALIAADDTGAIVATSSAAAAMLGYDEPSQLVGRRLAAIIPPRFRQAHVAGFTLHLYKGRRGLLDRTTRVQVLCRDGSELSVDMTVRAHELPPERTVFTAMLQSTLR